MKVKEFTYTKANGEVSQRTLFVTQEPKTNVAGYDVSSLDFDEYAQVAMEFSEMLSRHKVELAELAAKYDLTHNYRQFIPDNMSNVTTETI